MCSIDLFMFSRSSSNCIWDTTHHNKSTIDDDEDMLWHHGRVEIGQTRYSYSLANLTERVRCQATFRSACNAASPKETRQSNERCCFCRCHCCWLYANAPATNLVEVGQSSRRVVLAYSAVLTSSSPPSYINIMMNWKRDHRLETFLLRRWSSTAHIQ